MCFYSPREISLVNFPSFSCTSSHFFSSSPNLWSPLFSPDSYTSSCRNTSNRYTTFHPFPFSLSFSIFPLLSFFLFRLILSLLFISRILRMPLVNHLILLANHVILLEISESSLSNYVYFLSLSLNPLPASLPTSLRSSSPIFLLPFYNKNRSLKMALCPLTDYEEQVEF